jgi:LmbE family N-acetylglucosaminyl deacetylase
MASDPPRVAVIVAHPDDETLWAGGLLLMHPQWRTTVVTLCRGSDADRAPRFRRVLERYGASGAMGDLDDGPEQAPLPPAAVEEAVLSLLPQRRFDRVLTHGRDGEYTRHRRHEETCRAAVTLWALGEIESEVLWTFAYDDDARRKLPEVSDECDVRVELPEEIWTAKRDIVTTLYGFAPDSWEARTTPRLEGFRTFSSARTAREWVEARRLDA